jgi:cell division protein FtsB
LIWIVVGVIVLWGVWAFGSEMMLNLRLNAQVQALRAENSRLADSNAQTRTELETAASAAAMEESARQQGYYRQGEQVYVIVQPTPSATAVVVSSKAGGSKTAGSQASGGGETVWTAISKWWRQVWH